MKNKYLGIFALVIIFIIACATAKNEINPDINYPKLPNNFVPFFDEKTDSNMGTFYKDMGRGVETSHTFSSPVSNKPSLIIYLLTSVSFPNMNTGATFELVSISGDGGAIIGKCISSSGMAQGDFKKNQTYTLCDSYEIIGEGIGAELRLIGGKIGSNIVLNLIEPQN